MDSFLAASKAALANLAGYERIRVAMGNGTADLDSAVSALIQAFSEYLDAARCNDAGLAVIPLMNIPRAEYRLKTEVLYFLETHEIRGELLTFRDEIDLRRLRSEKGAGLELILLDHHTLPDEDVFLADSVKKVIDHRPRDARWTWPGRELLLEPVASCATLVARNFLTEHPEAVDARVASLLRGPILIDTANFSTAIDRATPADVEVVRLLEKVGGLDRDRAEVFEAIARARADVGRLTAADLLVRDLKWTDGVPIVGLPAMLVKDFLELRDAVRSIERFAEARKASTVVLQGMQLRGENVSRDLGIFSSAGDPLADKIAEALTAATGPSLDLRLDREIPGEAGDTKLLLYEQGNPRATRKHVLPIVREAIVETRRNAP